MPVRPRTISENITSSTRSFNSILSPRQTFHKGCNCVSSSLSSAYVIYLYIYAKNVINELICFIRFNDSGLSTWDTSFSKSIDTTDGISSFYTSLSDQRSAILEEKQEDFVSYTPLDRGIDILYIYLPIMY